MCVTPARRPAAPPLRHLGTVSSRVVPAGSPARAEAEGFIARVFGETYGARVPVFAPHLMVVERHGRLVAAAGWRAAGDARLYLERYLDEPVEHAVSRLAGRPIPRGRIAEACNLAARPGHGVRMIGALAEELDRQGHEWVVFTATRELVGIFGRLGLPPLGLAPAEPGRVGDEAAAWGRYYDTAPVVVAGRIRLALERSRHA